MFQLENEEELTDWVNLLDYNINLHIKKDVEKKSKVIFVFIRVYFSASAAV